MTFDLGDPVLDPWDDRATPARRWRSDWAARAAAATNTPAAPAIRSGFVHTHARCVELGYTPAQRRSLVRRQIWFAPRRGVVAVVHPKGDVKVGWSAFGRLSTPVPARR